MARTNTTTSTYTRMSLLKMQVRIALRRAVGIGPAAIKTIALGVEKKWIKTIRIYGVDRKDKCHVELTVEIDWSTHDFQVSLGKTQVSTKGWDDETAIELDEAINLFSTYVKAKELIIKWTVTYIDGVNSKKVDAELGLKDADPITWYSKDTVESRNTIPEIEEMTIGLKAVK